ncbi:ABC transporter permease [Streptomyces sp. NBC_01549]|uniref:ABC transporter permease n=1 Tax=Streptomyces TaxID=1883 RepID=UPI0022597189|nr:ABC transporter permease [Streptomyces sp. NBC_01549]MCX4588604.1 ABC transporter permease [Streptomyces sp. NBC_01549]
MRNQMMLLTTATRYALVEHARNRFAVVLIALFLPVWVLLAHAAIPDTPARLHLRATGELLAPRGNEITAISGALNAVTLITGFLMFAATFTSSGFDRRLAMAGYPRTHLVAAKVVALTFVCALIAAYATAVTCLTWTPRQPVLLTTAFFCAGLTYGVLGVGFGALLRREVEGMFAIVMTSIVDLLLQNPITSSGAGSTITRFLPSYGAMQAATAAGFSSVSVPRYVLWQLAWFTAAALLGLLAFHRRTRTTLTVTPHGPVSEQSARHQQTVDLL